MAKKEHLLYENFLVILGLRANLNLGMSERLKIAFPNTVPVARPKVPLRKINHPN